MGIMKVGPSQAPLSGSGYVGDSLSVPNSVDHLGGLRGAIRPGPDRFPLERNAALNCGGGDPIETTTGRIAALTAKLLEHVDGLNLVADSMSAKMQRLAGPDESIGGSGPGLASCDESDDIAALAGQVERMARAVSRLACLNNAIQKL